MKYRESRLDRKIDAAEAERRRLVDIYQAGLVELRDLHRRAAEVAARLLDLHAKQASLAQHRATLARDNQLRRRVHDFAGRVHSIIDQLDNAQKQHLCRLLIEQVRVTGWHVEIRLRIPLDPEPGKPAANHPHPCQAKTVCVPLVTINGPSYRLKDRLTLVAEDVNPCHDQPAETDT